MNVISGGGKNDFPKPATKQSQRGKKDAIDVLYCIYSALKKLRKMVCVGQRCTVCRRTAACGLQYIFMWLYTSNWKCKLCGLIQTKRIQIALIKTGCALIKTIFCYTKVLGRNTAKQTCGSGLGSVCWSRTEEMQKNVLNWLAAVIRKNKRDSAGNSKKVVQLWLRRKCFSEMAMYVGLQSVKHIGVRGGGAGGAAAPSCLKNFRANSVFRATASSSKILNNKIYFSTVKNSRATLFFRASASCSKILNNKKHIQYSEFRAPSVLQASASCSKILNVKSVFHKAKNFWATLFFRASSSC